MSGRHAPWLALVVLSACASQPVVVDPLPDAIHRAQREGRVTIVAFVDVECEYSRALYRTLRQTLPGFPSAAVVPVFVPIRDRSVPTLRALVCAQQQGQDFTDPMMNESDRSPEQVRVLARRANLDLEALDRCAEDERSLQRLRSDVGMAQALGVRGLPTFFVGNEMFRGVPSQEEIQASLQRASRETLLVSGR
ncbi:MAG: thioredoxin domain-containing protein [Myxococcota bacterium]